MDMEWEVDCRDLRNRMECNETVSDCYLVLEYNSHTGNLEIYMKRYGSDENDCGILLDTLKQKY